jgi:hypothetical protein
MSNYTIMSDEVRYHTIDPKSLTTYIKLYGVIKIDDTGFYYKDELVEDAGKAYELFMKVLEGKCNCD